MKILVVEDEESLAQVISESLVIEGYSVEAADTFVSAMQKLLANDYDCILLDIMLPGGSGLDLLRELKSLGKSDNVIIISAKDSVDDRVTGLDLGADDYLPKPFHMAELTARVKSVIRRTAMPDSHLIVVGNVSLAPEGRTLSVNGQSLAVNRKEFDILAYLIANRNRLVNKASLAEHVWGDRIDQSDDFEFIYSQMKNLRKKLKDNGADLEIQAVYGIGYKLVQA
ncbi:MAG: response regulator transcription factor [Dyadobacter sp.]|uniref:response regulator transcription factor n=1 Tax=Dyadobacter sp. TaxID=1914288 RepID=UPI001B0933E3|nr:response regulator transcription factor [Dyadobacter sp.]MBO9616521.1 response regulator transcription factor [Dyadobacter sp.]